MGIVTSLVSQTFPAAPTFDTTRDIPDLAGKVIIVTGGNAGIGQETVKALLLKNADTVYIAGRSQEKVEAAIKELQAQTGKTAQFLKIDLGDLKSIKSAAEEFFRKETRLDVLFNNAGVMFPDVNMVTSNGYDLQFGTNVLGHFYFTKLLLPLLVSTAKISPDGHTRVVNTSSSAAYGAALDFATFKDGPSRKKAGTLKLYGQSKFGNVVFARELARRYEDQGIVSTSLNPGNLRSDLQRHLSTVTRWIVHRFCYDPW